MPCANFESRIGWFAAIGRPSMSARSKFCPDDTDVVSRIGASAVTLTLSVMLPTSSVRLTPSVWPTLSTTSWFSVLKFGISTVTRYRPAWSSGASK